jgi:CheY-like chemotaxis protein
MKRRILLADDDADDRLLFEEVFSSLPSDQYQLYSVSNGEEVISFLRSINNPTHLPDLIILDQNMPLMSGREALEVIKRDEVLRNIPVIIYSTYNDNSFIDECLAQGVVAVVSKPDSYEGYIQMINHFLKYSAKPAT